MRYHTTHTLSPNIRETPEGYLVCEGVPIARTGVQEYLPEEVPVEPGPSGMVLVVRAEEDVFDPETIASFEGKSVTLDHPDPAPDPDDPDVNPGNWRELTCGVAVNVRRGAGGEADLLLADLIITDAEAITAVREKRLRQVSCGYDADYEEIRPGVGRQINIIGNHIALVTNGRAGWRVGIKDAAPENKETDMAVKQVKGVKKAGFLDRFVGHLRKGKTADEAAAAAAQDEDMPGNTPPEGEQPATDSGDDLAALRAQMDEMMLMIRALVEGKGTTDTDPDKTADEDPNKTDEEDPSKTTDNEAVTDSGCEEEPGATKTGDSRRSFRVADAGAVMRARVISPTLPAQVGDSLQAVQKQSLRRAMKDASLKNVLDGILRGRTLDAITPAELDVAFYATAEVAKHVNNRKTADGLANGKAATRDFGKPVSPADVNEANKKFYDRKAG